VKLHCVVCDTHYDPTQEHFVCPNSTSAHTHPLRKEFEYSDALLLEDTWVERWNAGENSYSIFREALGSYAMAKKAGRELEWENFLQSLERNAQKNHPDGFAPTPLVNVSKLAQKIGHRGGLFVKNETRTILGSHKARHAISSILYLETLRMLANRPQKHPLAIFSCGNAALGAAAIAQAAEYPLYTFVPATVSQNVESLLSNMGAFVIKVPREGSIGEGDPCYNLYHRALKKFHWTPFSCYGHDLWASTEGAEILTFELIAQIALEQTPPEHVALYGFQKAKLDNIVLQVGGGGLANGMISGLQSAVYRQMLQCMPRIFLAQTASCYPLAESYFTILKEITSETKLANRDIQKILATTTVIDLAREHFHALDYLIRTIAREFLSPSIQSILARVAAKRGHYFKPWNGNEPHSIAEGILDDTTYDGFEIVVAMLQTAGFPCILTEGELANGWKIGHESTELNVSATGTAGLAALLFLKSNHIVKPTENTSFLFTGVETRKAPPSVNSPNVTTISTSDTESFQRLPSLFSLHEKT
jgi:threonine synthase